MRVASRVPSWGASTIARCGMTIPVPEPDPHACKRASGDEAAVGDADADADGGGGGERAVSGRGELRLVVAAERDDPRAVAELEAAPSPGELGPVRGACGPARRLRLAGPVQLELVCDRQGRGPELVWASLPEQSREAVLVLLARLIDVGAVEEEDGA